MTSRTPDTELEFDFAKVVEQSRDNPVFYVQYAHARCCSVLRMAKEMFPQLDCRPAAMAAGSLGRLEQADELALIKQMAAWPRIVEAAAEAHEPHRVTYYLIELAGAFHSFWNKGKEDAGLRFLHANDPELSAARAALVLAVRTVVASGLGVLGVEPMEELRDAESTAA